MANVTIALDDQLLKVARVMAVQQGTSVNEICREAIAQFVRGAGDVQARLAEATPAPAPEPLWPGREVLYSGSRRRKN
jgi:plasmid stability protein